MDGDSYYQNLLQQGYSTTDAANYTKQYYPEFQAPMPGMEMMAPPPPGAVEFGGVASTGMAAPGTTITGAMAGGGIAAAGAGAAAGGGMSVATIAVVSVLVLGGAGTAGYFIYDYLTEPDFYGEIYWTEAAMGYIFEEDEMSIVIAVDPTTQCDELENVFGIADWTEKDELCYASLPYENYESTDEGDYYKICLTYEDGEEDCIEVYVYERGIALVDDDTCSVMVSDISTPNYGYETEEDYEDRLAWLEKLEDIADEIREDAPSECGNSIDEDEEYLAVYDFWATDAPGTISNNTGDRLVLVQMTQGDDIPWSLVKLDITIDGGAIIDCVDADLDDGSAACVFQNDGDNYWSTGEQIAVSEGNTDLCDGSNGGCDIVVTITKLGYGSDGDRVIDQMQAYADAVN